MPAPRSRVPKGEIVSDPSKDMGDGEESLIDLSEDKKDKQPPLERTITFDGVNGSKANRDQIRRTSNATDPAQQAKPKDPREQLKNLGPSNLASRPRQTRYNTVKIKPGGGNLTEAMAKSHGQTESHAQDYSSETHRSMSTSTAPQGGVGAGLLSSAGKDAKDGVAALQAGYGTMSMGVTSLPPRSKGRDSAPENKLEISPKRSRDDHESKTAPPPRPASTHRGRKSSASSAVGSLRSFDDSRSKSKHGVARSGSLSENVVEANGIKKTVLETTSSSEEADGGGGGEGGVGVGGSSQQAQQQQQQTDGANDRAPPPVLDPHDDEGEDGSSATHRSGKKKRRRRKRSKKSEDKPLLKEEDGDEQRD